jgi:4-diphosphocytidyl-2-C-methyl-D-erythritol kinase
MKKLAKGFSPAKINLFFAVLGNRSDGYHDIFSANVAVDLCDKVEISPATGTCDEIFCRGIPLDDKNNSMVTAMKLFREKMPAPSYFRIFLEKNIPIGAGFGGGSGNGAAVLREVNRLRGNVLSSDELKTISGKIGADCPFFMDCVPSVVTGIGDICVPMDNEMVGALGNYKLLIFKPPFAINTAAAYALLREKFPHLYLTKCKAEERFFLLRNAIIAGETALPLFNTFAEIFFQKHKNLLDLVYSLKDVGASAMLTGSGSGFFCMAREQRHADAAEAMIRQALGKCVFVRQASFIL